MAVQQLSQTFARTSRSTKIVLISLGALMVVIAIGSLIGASSRSSSRTSTAKPMQKASPPPGGQHYTAVPPLTDNPPQTPVEEEYNHALASGLAASSTVQAASAAPVPAPAVSRAWPQLPEANTPEQWASQFATSLLSVNFTQQTRAGLGSWLQAEESPELLPGVPAAARDKILYLSLLEPTSVGASSSPIPDQATWQADTAAGTKWTVSNVAVQSDPRFAQLLAQGWQPTDERFTAEDVSGTLSAQTGTGTPTSQTFSMVLYLGSAHWHQGYGSVLVSSWKEG